MLRPVAGCAHTRMPVTKGSRLRKEIEALRAEAKRRRAIAHDLVEAIDRLQSQIDELFTDQSSDKAPVARKKLLKK